VVYVGDDFRDIQSGFNAGCFTVAAGFGFCSSDRPIEQWGADVIVMDAVALGEALS